MNRQELLISRLVGFVRALEGNEEKAGNEVHRCILDYINYYKHVDEQTFLKMLDQILEFKKMLVPGCFECTSKCGRTFDYNFDDLNNDDLDIQTLKRQIIQLIETQASLNNIDNIQYIYRCIYSIGGKDWSIDYYKELLNEKTA